MSLRVCPIATVQASAEMVWSLIADPRSYDIWWEAHTDSISPPGPAQAGQEIRAHAGAFGLSGLVRIRVESVDAGLKELNMTTSLPFGITVLNHIKVVPAGEKTCRVSFG